MATTDTLTKLRDRANKKRKKRESKKRQIAQNAITTLKHLGYANTSLRDIAANSELSLGMLHYYFEDKTQLIIYCVRIYKKGFIQTIQAVLETADNKNEALSAFARGLADTIVEDAETHKLWYDIRSQAMFNEEFQPVVKEIESALIDVVAMAVKKIDRTLDVMIFYAALDGLFRFQMQEYCTGTHKSHKEIFTIFEKLLVRL